MAPSATGREGEGTGEEGGGKGEGRDRKWGRSGGQGEYASQLRMSVSAMESSDESVRALNEMQVVRRVPN